MKRSKKLSKKQDSNLKKTKKKKEKKNGKKSKAKKEKKVKKIKAKINLRVAKRDDFMQIDKYVKKSNKQTKKFKPIYGKPYWMFNSKGVIENKPYILTEDTNFVDFADYLNREQILIPINPLDIQ